MGKPIHFVNQESVLYEHAGRKVKVTSQALGFSFGPPFSFVWNRPLYVRVQNEDGSEQRIPVIDKTRILQILILMVGLLGVFVLSRSNK